jgi:simple sugar transport system substrate-binding protein
MRRKVDPKVEETIETLNMKNGPTRRRLLEGTGLVSASAAAAALLSACGNTPSSAATGVAGDFPKTPKWQFWFVNHVTTNPFFGPTQYGLADAAALLGLPVPHWGGSTDSAAGQMVSAIETAISAKAAGIATTVINGTSFTGPVSDAMNAGIPVISYNADGTYLPNGTQQIGTNRLCYVGQALFLSGQQLGEKIKTVCPTPGLIPLFIQTPGTGNIQPRFDGAASVLTPAGYKVTSVTTTTSTGTGLALEKSFLLGHRDAVGAFAVDSTSTSNLAEALTGAGLKIPSGGFDTAGPTLAGIEAGLVDFTIYQDPYLQGFLPVLYLYLYNISGGTLSPPDTDTGLSFVSKINLAEYNLSSRYQGSTTAQKYLQRPSGAINSPMATTST